MKIIPCVQYSPEWWEARQGIPTASEFNRILTAKQEKHSSQMDDYVAELIADRACQCPPFFTERSGHTAAMRNGINCEPEARRFYELERNLDVQQVGFITTDDGRFGCSPDGLILDAGEIAGALELKCPTLKVQASYLLEGGLPSEYKAQVHGQLIVTGLPWVDFLSYSVGLHPVLVRVETDKFTEKLRAALEVFWTKYQNALSFIESRQTDQFRAAVEKGAAV